MSAEKNKILRIDKVSKAIKAALRFKSNKYYLVDKSENTAIDRKDLEALDNLIQKEILITLSEIVNKP
jgi:hypothetical protein